MHPYLIRNIGPPSSMFHHHRVPLFAFQSFICSFDALAHSCASHPLSCKWSAHPGLSMTITALVVYQAWLCPLVWCCLIHHEDLNRSFILCIILRIVLSLIVRIVPIPSRLSTSHKLASSWNNTLQVMLSPVFMEIIQSSRHASHSLQWKTHRCTLNVLSHGFLSACQIR
jgi:magnesium-transporting ATPase (P-type)